MAAANPGTTLPTQFPWIINGTEAADFINGNSSSEFIYGNGGSDNLFGNGGNDTIYGGTGDDLLNGGNGNDLLVGGAGNDRFFGGSGYDTVSYQTSNSRVVVDMVGGVNNILSDATGDTYNSIEFIVGTQFDDQFILSDEGVVVDAGAGHDLIRGGAGSDVMYGGAGNDRLDGEGGADYLFGGNGNDRINGDSGDDFMLGGDGNDDLDGGDGNDIIDGGAGNDTLEGGLNNDILTGDVGDDFLDGGHGSDTMTGGAGRDTFSLWTSSRPGPTGDHITDFVSGEDILQLGTQGSLYVGVAPWTSNALYSYNPLTGALYIDVGGQDKLVAIFENRPTLSISDFSFV